MRWPLTLDVDVMVDVIQYEEGAAIADEP